MSAEESAEAGSKGAREVDETPTTSGGGTGLPGLRGVDHLGITVPDMEQATTFFVDVLGCELLYEREPPGDDSPRDRLGVPAGSRIQAVRFLRCANGANVELFEFYSPDQREDFPRPSDVGIQHLALYVEDLDAAVEHLRRHGVELMSGPNPLPPKVSATGWTRTHERHDERRRTVKVSRTALEALTSHLTRQLEEIDRTGDKWQENGLVFAS